MLASRFTQDPVLVIELSFFYLLSSGNVSRLKHELSLASKGSPVVPASTKETEKKEKTQRRMSQAQRAGDANKADESKIKQIEENYEV